MGEASSDAFLEACGASGPLHLWIAHRKSRQAMRRTVPHPFVLVSRKAPDLGVSRGHAAGKHLAYLQVITGRMFGIVLRNSPGVGREALQSAWLDHRQLIRTGRFEIRLLEGIPQDDPWLVDRPSPLTPGSLDAHLVPRVTLEVAHRGARLRHWKMNRLLALVGSSPACQVRLRDGSVAPVQCSLVGTPKGVWAVDLLGQGRLVLNHARVPFGRVGDGGLLQVGQFTLRLRYDSSTGLGAPLRAAAALPAVALPPAASPSASAPSLPVRSQFLGAPLGRRAGKPASDLSPELVRVARSLLVPLADQFGQIQEQMFDQAVHALMTVFQRLAPLQQEQQESIRREVNRLEAIAGELQALAAEFTRGAPAAPPAQPASRLQPVLAGSSAGGDLAGGCVSPAEAPARKVADIHELLCQRLSAIQEEQEGGWQRVLNFLLGSVRAPIV
jgi:hypothetical protein